MDNDIRQIINSLFRKNVNVDEFGFIQIPDKVISQSLDPQTINTNNNDIDTHIKKRCQVCKKKTGLDYFICGEGIFCSNHRYHHTHNCNYDVKKEYVKILTENNPKIIKEKLERI